MEIDVELVTFGLGVVVAGLGAGTGLIWSMVREESKLQAENLALKADKETLAEVEARAIAAIQELKQTCHSDLADIKASTAKMVDRLDERYGTGLKGVSESLTVQIDKSEKNIMARIELMMELVKAKVV